MTSYAENNFVGRVKAALRRHEADAALTARERSVVGEGMRLELPPETVCNLLMAQRGKVEVEANTPEELRTALIEHLRSALKAFDDTPPSDERSEGARNMLVQLIQIWAAVNIVPKPTVKKGTKRL